MHSASRGTSTGELITLAKESYEAPDEEQAAGDLDGSEPTSKVAVDDILYDRWESRNRSWNRLSTRTVHCRSIEPSHVIREPGASDEQTTDPSEDERQMAKVGSEDT